MRIRKGSPAWHVARVGKGAAIAAAGLTMILLLGVGEAPPEQPEPIEQPAVTQEVITVSEPQVYAVPLDNALQLYIANLCEDYHIDMALVLAVIEVESQYNADAVGDGGDSIGLMQIQSQWHEERMARLGVKDLANPYENVTVGIDYLAEKLNEGLGLEWALMAYNGGNTHANTLTAQGKVSEYAYKVGLTAYEIGGKEDVLQ